MSNYPDDILNYSDDPRSPFYEEPPEGTRHQDLVDETLLDLDKFNECFDDMTDDLMESLRAFTNQEEGSKDQLFQALITLVQNHCEEELE